MRLNELNEKIKEKAIKKEEKSIYTIYKLHDCKDLINKYYRIKLQGFFDLWAFKNKEETLYRIELMLLSVDAVIFGEKRTNIKFYINSNNFKWENGFQRDLKIDNLSDFLKNEFVKQGIILKDEDIQYIFDFYFGL